MHLAHNFREDTKVSKFARYKGTQKMWVLQ